MPKLQPVDESFLSTAPKRYTQTWEVARPATEVWAELVADHPLDWCRGLKVDWTSPRPFGIGTTRQARALGVLTVQEHFFIWEEGRRYAFYVTSCNAPLFSAFAEDYVVNPVDADRCTMTWTVALAPSTLGKPGGPVNDLLFGSFFRDCGKHYAAAGVTA